MKLVLIDRDGVINEELPEWIVSPDMLRIYPHALEAFALFKRAGFTCVVVTNQSVVGRGIIDEKQLARIHDYMREQVRKAGGEIADVLYCADAPDQPTYRRKPKPGMLIEALKKYNAKAEDTAFIGDAETDLQAATEAGCLRYLVMTGKGQTTLKTADSYAPVVVCADLLDAAKRIAKV